VTVGVAPCCGSGVSVRTLVTVEGARERNPEQKSEHQRDACDQGSQQWRSPTGSRALVAARPLEHAHGT